MVLEGFLVTTGGDRVRHYRIAKGFYDVRISKLQNAISPLSCRAWAACSAIHNDCFLHEEFVSNKHCLNRDELHL